MSNSILQFTVVALSVAVVAVLTCFAEPLGTSHVAAAAVPVPVPVPAPTATTTTTNPDPVVVAFEDAFYSEANTSDSVASVLQTSTGKYSPMPILEAVSVGENIMGYALSDMLNGVVYPVLQFTDRVPLAGDVAMSYMNVTPPEPCQGAQSNPSLFLIDLVDLMGASTVNALAGLKTSIQSAGQDMVNGTTQALIENLFKYNVQGSGKSHWAVSLTCDTQPLLVLAGQTHTNFSGATVVFGTFIHVVAPESKVEKLYVGGACTAISCTSVAWPPGQLLGLDALAGVVSQATEQCPTAVKLCGTVATTVTLQGQCALTADYVTWLQTSLYGPPCVWF
jgi:hypothetical protein